LVNNGLDVRVRVTEGNCEMELVGGADREMDGVGDTKNGGVFEEVRVGVGVRVPEADLDLDLDFVAVCETGETETLKVILGVVLGEVLMEELSEHETGSQISVAPSHIPPIHQSGNGQSQWLLDKSKFDTAGRNAGNAPQSKFTLRSNFPRDVSPNKEGMLPVN